jgi:membrane fusion protein, multidrug efflux system
MRSRCLAMSIGAAFLVSGCGDSKPSNGSTAASGTLPPAVSANVAPPTTSPTDIEESSIIVSGPIIVEHQLDLCAQRDGMILKIHFDTPARVKAGALLARMDDRQLTANLEAARAKSRSIEADLKNWEAETEVLKADYVRAQHLWDLGLTSEEQLQHAKFKVDSDQWDVKRVAETLNTSRSEERSLELELEKTKITAPFDGLVARRYVHEGQSVTKGDRLFWLTAESPLLMRFTLPEKYFGQVRPAQILEASSADVPDQKRVVTIKQISPVIDPSSGTFEVLVEFVGDRGAFRPGMNASVKLEKPH